MTMLSSKTTLTLRHRPDKSRAASSLYTFVSTQLRKPKLLAAAWLCSLSLAWAYSLPGLCFCLTAGVVLYVSAVRKSWHAALKGMWSKMVDAAYFLTYLLPISKPESPWLLSVTSFLDRPAKRAKADKA